VRERPGTVTDGVQAAAGECVLDSTNRSVIVCTKQRHPAVFDEAVARGRRDRVWEQCRQKYRCHDKLDDLQGFREELATDAAGSLPTGNIGIKVYERGRR
jgi:hypothetical protein